MKSNLIIVLASLLMILGPKDTELTNYCNLQLQNNEFTRSLASLFIETDNLLSYLNVRGEKELYLNRDNLEGVVEQCVTLMQKIITDSGTYQLTEGRVGIGRNIDWNNPTDTDLKENEIGMNAELLHYILQSVLYNIQNKNFYELSRLLDSYFDSSKTSNDQVVYFNEKTVARIISRLLEPGNELEHPVTR